MIHCHSTYDWTVLQHLFGFHQVVLSFIICRFIYESLSVVVAADAFKLLVYSVLKPNPFFMFESLTSWSYNIVDNSNSSQFHFGFQSSGQPLLAGSCVGNEEQGTIKVSMNFCAISTLA